MSIDIEKRGCGLASKFDENSTKNHWKSCENELETKLEPIQSFFARFAEKK